MELIPVIVTVSLLLAAVFSILCYVSIRDLLRKSSSLEMRLSYSPTESKMNTHVDNLSKKIDSVNNNIVNLSKVINMVLDELEDINNQKQVASDTALSEVELQLLNKVDNQQEETNKYLERLNSILQTLKSVSCEVELLENEIQNKKKQLSQQ